MRRALAALLVLPLLAAGCSGADSDDGTDGAAPGAGPAGAGGSSAGAAPPPGSAAALSGNAKTVCDGVERISTSFGETYLADLKLQIDAASRGAAARSEAEQKIDRDVTNYSAQLAALAELAEDTRLKTALTQVSKQVTALKGDVNQINAEKMSALTATLDQACGKG